MLYELLMKSLSVKVTLRHAISSSFLQKLSEECQPMASYLSFRSISCNSFFLLEVPNWPVKPTCLSWDSVTLRGCSLLPMCHCCLVVKLQLGNDSFLPTHMVNNEKVCAVSIFDIALNQGHTLVRMLYLASICKNTMFELSLCQISALSIHFYSQFWSISQFV